MWCSLWLPVLYNQWVQISTVSPVCCLERLQIGPTADDVMFPCFFSPVALISKKQFFFYPRDKEYVCLLDSMLDPEWQKYQTHICLCMRTKMDVWSLWSFSGRVLYCLNKDNSGCMKHLKPDCIASKDDKLCISQCVYKIMVCRIYRLFQKTQNKGSHVKYKQNES